MRTNIIIDDKLMEEALKLSGLGTKRAAVDAGLRLLIQVKMQTGIRRLRGKVAWEGDVSARRARRTK
jgi:Arc/MetJ family transcription regulator